MEAQSQSSLGQVPVSWAGNAEDWAGDAAPAGTTPATEVRTPSTLGAQPRLFDASGP